MSDDLLTERAKSAIESLALLMRLAMVVFIGWTLSLRMPWHDALAIVFAFVLVRTALIPRGTR